MRQESDIIKPKAEKQAVQTGYSSPIHGTNHSRQKHLIQRLRHPFDSTRFARSPLDLKPCNQFTNRSTATVSVRQVEVLPPPLRSLDASIVTDRDAQYQHMQDPERLTELQRTSRSVSFCARCKTLRVLISL